MVEKVLYAAAVTAEEAAANTMLHCKFNTHFQLYQSLKEISHSFCDCKYESERACVCVCDSI